MFSLIFGLQYQRTVEGVRNFKKGLEISECIFRAQHSKIHANKIKNMQISEPA